MITSGILTAVGVVAIAAKFSPTFLKRMLGYEEYVDIVVTGGLTLIFAATGTYSGIMTAVITGLCISAVLFVTGRLYGKERYLVGESGQREWLPYKEDERWSVKRISQFIYGGTLGRWTETFREDWEQGKSGAVNG